MAEARHTVENTFIRHNSSTPESLLALISVLWLAKSAAGATVTIREDLPGAFAGMTRWHDTSSDFFKGAGTALSPGLPMMVAHAIFTALSTRGGTVGVAGMTALGAGATLGVLGEPIAYQALSPTTFDPVKSGIVSAAIVLSSLMTVLGMSRLLALRGRT
jgi:hypothetical protein